ncbi:MAG: sigma-54-dependent Fis family transcriptional regulator [Magnetococcales bacterium]|nr:sigma-54-dependent Fis family transcriptional regulator [Magnetococcales bacterium]
MDQPELSGPGKAGGTVHGIIGQSPPMKRLFKLIERVAASDATVLIQGESGTGKELISRAIHEGSPRREGPLIPVNCGAIPEELLESELFGHVKGAFTGAAFTRPGRFELAKGGTLFLDEIGDMSPKLQVKMLRVLQEKVVEPVGAVKPVKVDVRVIAATHKNLEEEVASGKFREDLFYRLNVVPLHAPPLRERLDDIPLLVNHFAERFAKIQDRPQVQIPAQIMHIFQDYEWRGNVREMQNLLERLTVLSDGDVSLEDLPSKMVKDHGQIADNDDESPIPARAFALPQNNHAITDFNREVEAYENQLILNALERTGWNKNKAARLLNLNRTTLVEKIKKKGLERNEPAAQSQLHPGDKDQEDGP